MLYYVFLYVVTCFVCQQNAWTTFRVGFFAGIFIVLVSVGIVCGKCLMCCITFAMLCTHFISAD